MINLRKNDALADAVKEILQQEALKGNQTKIDKNHNGKIDGQDFKILRGEKKTVKEEETVEEGLKDMAKKAVKALTGGSDEDQRKDLQRKMGVPQTGQKPTQKEEVEQIDELSKSTLGSYVKKASLNRSQLSYGSGLAASRGVTDDKGIEKDSQRAKGISKAVGRLTGEEVETQKTLRQFMENAFDYKSPRKPEPNGGSGVKQGSRYGGSKQKDKPEQDTDTKK